MAHVVKWSEDEFVGEVGGAPVALKGGVLTMARVAAKRNKQQIPLVKSQNGLLVKVWRLHYRDEIGVKKAIRYRIAPLKTIRHKQL